MNRSGSIGAALAALAVMAPMSARAEAGDVAVGGELLVTIKAAYGSYSIQQRADLVTERLQDILAIPNLTSADVTASNQKDGAVKILVRNHLLVTVTAVDGKVNGLSTAAEAKIWLQRLKREVPKVSARPNPNLRGE